MKTRKCAFFIFNGFADWEPALVTAGLNKFSDFSVNTFSLTGRSVISMGGLVVHPQSALENINPSGIDLLLLPGGDAWERGENREIIPLIKNVINHQKTIACICAATTILGQIGVLDHVSHTSNALEYLKQYCPEYKGEALYETKPCVSVSNIITANGAAMVEFAYEIFKAFQVFDEPALSAWKELYKSGGMINKLFEG